LNEATLDKIYRNESDARVKERLFLIVRVFSDKERIESVAKQMHRSRAWAYKWYKRYNDDGIDGLVDKPRIRRPSFVDKDMIVKIRNELSDSNTGWDTKQIMDLIQKKTGIKYHMGGIFADYFTSGVIPPKYRRKDLSEERPKKR
jgi:transposase